VNWTFWPSLVAAIGLLAVGRPLLALFGPQFVAGYSVMAVLVVGLLARAAVGPAELLLNMLGQQRLCAAAVAFSALLDIVLNLLWVPRFGALGAASATAVALTTAAAMYYVIARRRLGLRVAIWDNVPSRR
jgi:O-antigen/teichoic acid export membrane protein